MRILVLSNFYPPYAIGGMEYRCCETVNLMQKRGHEFLVLTSTYGVDPRGVVDGNVYRMLALESDLMHYQPIHFFLKSWREDRHNLGIFENLLHKYMPDVVFVWGMWNLSRQLPNYAEQVWNGPLVYSFANDWPAQPNTHELYWSMPAQHHFMRPFKWISNKLALSYLKFWQSTNTMQFNHVICASHSLWQQLLQSGVPLRNTQVIYPGIDIHLFSKNGTHREKLSNPGLSLLYAGSIVEHKGVHTAIEAMKYLEESEPFLDFRLTIVGSGHISYESRLKNFVVENKLEHSVNFINQIPRSDIPDLMHEYDTLIFPSIWEEPFSRMVLEAMASGLVVIGTDTGGTKEILEDGETGLIFPPEDARSLAECIQRLIDNPDLIPKLVKNGRELVAQRFDIHRMVDEIEIYLEKVARTRRQIGTL
jgi:glycogen synthase